MIFEADKKEGILSLTSTMPQSDGLPLGKALREVYNGLSDEFSEEGEASMERFLEANERFARPERIRSLSAPKVLKYWAAERLPALGVSYGYSNKIVEAGVKEVLEDSSPLRLMEFSEELSLIASFAREITSLRIEATPHAHGYRFQFAFSGKAKSEEASLIEESAVRALQALGSRDNSTRRRVLCLSKHIEAECITLRKKVRLGFSPVA